MAFWTSDEIKQRVAKFSIISPFVETNVKHCAYELSLGPEAYTTDSPNGKKICLSPDEQLVIHPGQFGLLLTEESISVPDDAMAFISIKAGIKFRGLVNVSGFHVDPGFSGRLKFSVYNAGSQKIILARGKPTFLIWFQGLVGKVSDPYNGSHKNQQELTPDDIMQIQGEVSSPAALRQSVDQVSKDVASLHRSVERIWGVIIAIGVGIVVGLVVRFALTHDNTAPARPALDQVERRAPASNQSMTSGDRRVGGAAATKERREKAKQ